MPKTIINYNNAVIYKLVCKDVEIKELYVGSTTNFAQRKTMHKSSCNNINSKGYNIYVYSFIRSNGGWENWDMVEIIKLNCVDGNELLRYERNYIEQLQAKLNKNIPTRTIKEYQKANKEKIIEYYETNKDHLKEYQKDYYEVNKDQLKECQFLDVVIHMDLKI